MPKNGDYSYKVEHKTCFYKSAINKKCTDFLHKMFTACSEEYTKCNFGVIDFLQKKKVSFEIKVEHFNPA